MSGRPVDQRDTTLTEIAARRRHLETLETRNSDSLDFHDMAVWSIKAALEAAYEAGRQSREPARTESRTRGSGVVERRQVRLRRASPRASGAPSRIPLPPDPGPSRPTPDQV